MLAIGSLVIGDLLVPGAHLLCALFGLCAVICGGSCAGRVRGHVRGSCAGSCVASCAEPFVGTSDATEALSLHACTSTDPWPCINCRHAHTCTCPHTYTSHTCHAHPAIPSVITERLFLNHRYYLCLAIHIFLAIGISHSRLICYNLA